jgi:hypothetical protein
MMEEKDIARSLYELLHTCTVRIAVSKEAQGTGFFVAPGMILTCTHVIQIALKSDASVAVSWNGQTTTAQIQEFRNVSSSDLALLHVNLSNHPCVLLQGGAEPFSQLYSYGYPDIELEGASTTFSCEGWAGEGQELLKFKLGRVRPGMSGSPLLNRETGCVCGIMQFTFDRNIDLGGKALLSKVVFREFPQLEGQQKQFHQQDRRWWNLLTHQQRQAIELESPASASKSAGAVEVFISYVRADEAWRSELAKRLKPMKREGLITEWYADNTSAGLELKEEAKKHLDTARIILLLVSPDFLDSDYHYDFEMAHALKRHNANTARVIPILLRHTEGWEQTEFHKLQALPRNGQPVKQWSDRDIAFAKIAREIRIVAEELKNA